MNACLPLLAEPRRLDILRLVWSQEVTAGEIARQFRVTFGAVSQHLAKLLSAGLVRRRRAGKHLYYIANRENLGPFAAALEAIWADKLTMLKQLAETEQRKVDAGRARADSPARHIPRSHHARRTEKP